MKKQTETHGVSQEAIELRDSLNKMVDKLIDEPLEYFMPSQSFGFKFNYLEAIDPNFAENLVEEINNKEEN